LLHERNQRRGRQELSGADYERLASALFTTASSGPGARGAWHRAYIARQMRGLTHEELGDHIGKAKAQVQSWELHKNLKPIPKKDRTAHGEALAVDPRWIESGDPQVDPPWLRPYRQVVSDLHTARIWAAREGLPMPLADITTPEPQDLPANHAGVGLTAWNARHPATLSPLSWVKALLKIIDTHLTNLDHLKPGSSEVWLRDHRGMVEALPYVPYVWDQWKKKTE